MSSSAPDHTILLGAVEALDELRWRRSDEALRSFEVRQQIVSEQLCIKEDSIPYHCVQATSLSKTISAISSLGGGGATVQVL